MNHIRRNRKTQQSNIVAFPNTAYKVENSLGKNQPVVNVADRMQSIVSQEFDKIKKTLNISK